MEGESLRQQDDRASARLLEVLGGVFLAVGGKDTVSSFMAGESIKSSSAALAIVGIVLLVCGVFWYRIRPASDTRFTRSLATVASNARSWYFPLVGFALYVAITGMVAEIRQNNEIVGLRNDVQSIAKVINRGLLPRQLTKNQQRQLSTFLLRFEPHEFAFQMPLRDVEAGNFRSDLERALIKGGWSRSLKNPYDYTNDLPEGLSINFIQTAGHSQKAEDPRIPTADRLLMMAFGLAGVRLDGTGGTVDQSITQDLVIIQIGPRRKDSYDFPTPDGVF